ncbi:DNA alkylation repair protein [Halarcobacter ebronensis]|uniref:DNA alkylation repair protein n=1 Tax=Halarcobacter ebronensis TaxID=1462615 RepID=A0A4Q1AUM8_9BACT|nr:DNA alkylation repair protein [Halarcobacter ebronensis]QKF81555.1 3-methyladenine DNA glycosylase [Halarcobacter ebronensis]RXK05483.1 DNA alkylation repair protein [Halarcobacter ebronensis]
MAEQLKNVYTKNYIKNLSDKIQKQYEDFDSLGFENAIFDKSWSSLELKQRMRHIATTLNKFLLVSYKKQLEILKIVSKDFSGFEAMFFQDFVEVFGLDDFENSMVALEVFTIDSSSEFAIREFILRYEDKTMAQMKLWAKADNEHLRRLASEGCRPRLPWAVALPSFKQNPIKVLEIIELLKNDKSKYVQKSVANNLNDISKDNPDILVKFLLENYGKTKELNWICKHASRTLLKQGEKRVLKLFGYEELSSVEVKNFSVDKEVELQEELNFSFELVSFEEIGNVRLEYIIYYKKANNRHNKKIFMITQNRIKTKNKTFVKKQSFKDMTTRKHYKGEHFISIVINGKEVIKKEFFLI